MFLQHKPSGDLVEILNPKELWNPYLVKVKGRFHAGEEMQDPEPFTKSHLIFPSGEALPLCWFDPAYRQHMSIPDIAVHT
ncbi:hypothetical protein Lepto7375DRAFT_0382 [Leptolyngbya sp. PCC 7375]|nr:hypothetical protein Lepto7375DRAFT_0382 [Leptolyngbya sp. PCC 7375]